MSVLTILSLPFVGALIFAIAAAMHYGGAAMRQAQDLPNLPMAMIGGAVAGGLAAFLAIGGVYYFGISPNHVVVGVLFAGLAGEYLGGRVEEPSAAVLRGMLCAVLCFPIGALLMAFLLGQVTTR